MIVIPLGCISMRRRFYLVETETGEIELSQRYYELEVGGPLPPGLVGERGAVPAAAPRGPKPTPAWLRVLLWVWGLLVSGVFWLVGTLIGLVDLVKGLLARRRSGVGPGRSGAPRPGPGPAGGTPTPAAPVPSAPTAPPAMSPALGGAQAQGAGAIRVPSFAADPVPDAAPTVPGPGDVVSLAQAAPGDPRVRSPEAPARKNRAARKAATPKPAAAPKTEPAPVKRTRVRAEPATKPAPKKVSPAARAQRRPRGGNGKSPGVAATQPGPVDPDAV